VVNEESNSLKELVAQFNRIEHAMHQFFMRGTIAAENSGLHNLHENQEAFDALLKKVVNESHLIIKPVTTQEEFNQMYALYKEAFPDEDEREGYHELWKYAKGEEMEGGKYYTELWVVKAMNVVIGGVIFDIVACDAGRFSYGSAWYSFLAKEAQKKGISHHYFEVREQVVKSRGGMMSYPLFGLFCEMDIPKGHDTALSSMDPSDRLKIWRSMGWLYVDTYYEQPPLAADKKAVPLLLHCIPFEPGDWAKKEGIPADQFRAWLDTWIEYGFADEEDEELTALQEQSKQRMLHKMKVVDGIVPFAPAGNAVKERFHLLLENIMYPEHEELQLKESGA